MATLTIYNLGQHGVNVDKDPIHLEDGELLSAQNIIPDPLGITGGVVNRLGLAHFNSVAAADTTVGLLGGIGVPLLRPSTRTLYLGEMNSSFNGHGWDTSTAAFTAPTTNVLSPIAPRGYNKANAVLGAGASGWIFTGIAGVPWQNQMIYASESYVQGTDSPPLRAWDGTNDKELFRIPTNPTIGTVSQVIVSMIVANNVVYLAVADTGTSSANYQGRVFQYNPIAGTLTQLGGTFPTGYMPYSLCFANGKLWCGTSSGADPTFSGRIYYIRPGVDTAWTLDFTSVVGNGDITSLCTYNGYLYATTVAKNTLAALVKQRDANGVWTTSDTGTATTTNNHYDGLAVFGTNLYVSYVDITNNTVTIRKYNGASWSQVYSGTGHLSFPLMFSDNNIFYAVSSGFYGGVGAFTLLSTPDGTTWTDRTANTFNNSVPAYGVILT